MTEKKKHEQGEKGWEVYKVLMHLTTVYSEESAMCKVMAMVEHSEILKYTEMFMVIQTQIILEDHTSFKC